MSTATPNGNGNGQQSQAMVVGPKARQATLKTMFEKAKDSIAAVMPKHLTAERLLKIVLSATSRTPDLLECTPESILLAVMQAGSLGLEPNTPLGLSYLVPYKNQKKGGRKEAQFIPGYRGLMRLAIQSGEVQWIQARVIHERDVYEIEYGLTQKLVHSPFTGQGGAGAAIAFYAVAEMKNGARVFEFMSCAEVDAIRNRSKASTDGPWVTDFSEMAKKTVIRRLCKSLPLSEEKLGKALEIQGRVESGDGPDFGDFVIDVPSEDVAELPAEVSRTDALAAKVSEKAS